MAYSKTTKLNLYKFVQIKESDADANVGLDDPSAAKALNKNINNNTRAINNLGTTINSLANVLVDIKTINLERLNEQVDKKKKFKPTYNEPEKKKTFTFFKKLSQGKVPSFLEGILGLLAAAFKWFVLLPTMKWLADPANQDKVVNILTGISKIIKFIFRLTEFGVTNTLDGLYDLLKDDATWWERLKGFGQAFIGLGTLFLGLRWLNPLKIGRTIGDFKGVLNFFRNNLKRSMKLMKSRKMRMRGGGALGVVTAVGTGAYLFSQGRDDSALNQGLESVADNVPGLRPDPETDVGKKAGDWLGGLIKGAGSWLTGLGKDRNKEQQETQPKKKKGLFGWGFMGLAAGGMVPMASAGGWIQGPHSGYPVSLDGKGVDFIGHGTEWVGRSAGGKAYVVPFDTGATRNNPNLTANRWDEARRLGFTLPGLDEGGQFDFSKRLIKLHEGLRLNRYTDSKGLPTIGFGHQITARSPMDIKHNNRISEQRANQLFADDFNYHINFAKKIPGYGKASRQQRIALHDLTYNMGPNWHTGFPKFMAAFQKGDYKTAAAELRDSAWYQQVGRRAPTIVSLMENQGLGNASYLKSLGALPGDKSKKGNFFTRALSGVGNFFFGSSAGASTLDSGSFFDDKETAKEGKGSPNVMSMSNPETGKGFNPGGAQDMAGRPIVLSRDAAESLARMIADSKGVVSPSRDVKFSGRSDKKNKQMGGHANSKHLYGLALDVYGKSAKWIKEHGSEYGWKINKNKAIYRGKGSSTTQKLLPHGAGASFGWSGKGSSGLLGAASSGMSMEERVAKGHAGASGGGNRGNASQVMAQKREKQDLIKHQKARDYARQEIQERTQGMIKQVMGQVNVANSENRQAVSAATQLIQQLMGQSRASAPRMIPAGGGGGGRGTEGGFGSILRTTATVLNSFNNPLRGLFK